MNNSRGISIIKVNINTLYILSTVISITKAHINTLKSTLY